MAKKKNNSKIVGFDGDDCPRCGQPTIIFEHREITDKLRSQPFYYRRWFCCRNNDCQTKQIMPEKFKVGGEGRMPDRHNWGHSSPRSRGAPRDTVEDVRDALGLPSGSGPLRNYEKPPWED